MQAWVLVFTMVDWGLFWRLWVTGFRRRCRSSSAKKLLIFQSSSLGNSSEGNRTGKSGRLYCEFAVAGQYRQQLNIHLVELEQEIDE